MSEQFETRVSSKRSRPVYSQFSQSTDEFQDVPVICVLFEERINAATRYFAEEIKLGLDKLLIEDSFSDIRGDLSHELPCKDQHTVHDAHLALSAKEVLG